MNMNHEMVPNKLLQATCEDARACAMAYGAQGCEGPFLWPGVEMKSP